MFTFIHSGRMGDILYSLYAAKRISARIAEQFDYVLRTGVSAWDPSGRPHMMEISDAEFLKPLLEAQPYIREVKITDNRRTEGYVLDSFRRNMSLVIGREIRLWYYDPRQHVAPDEFSRPVLTAPDAPQKKPWIAVCFTPRYRQKFDLPRSANTETGSFLLASRRNIALSVATFSRSNIIRSKTRWNFSGSCSPVPGLSETSPARSPSRNARRFRAFYASHRTAATSDRKADSAANPEAPQVLKSTSNNS